MAESDPVPDLLHYYTRIANILDEETHELQRSKILTGTDQCWRIIESLSFPEVNASDPAQKLNLIFQRTADFENFLDHTTCLIRGRKGTGKTATQAAVLRQLWEEAAQDVISPFEDFVAFLSEVGILEWRPKDQRYRFADIYVYGFELSRPRAI